tara:strand:- start:628 stop:1773 length:1146 start_codon:yes stop_codon:yes gene_type:complete
MSNSLNPTILLTRDGTPTLQLPNSEVTYHSIHGALSEAQHVFISEGIASLKVAPDQAIEVLEVGFGTGLNAALTLLWAKENNRIVHYRGLEPHPIAASFWEDYPWKQGSVELAEALKQMQSATSGSKGVQMGGSTFQVDHRSIENFTQSSKGYDIIYYDAFAPSHQPELWTKSLFTQLRHLVRSGGVLVTYCAKGLVRRNLMAAGWNVEQIPGPPGKREMIRAIHHPVSRFNVRVYGMILDETGERLLICNERLPDGSYAQKFPGGGVELGEGVMDAWWRECQEELGCQPAMQSVELFHTVETFIRSIFRPDDQLIALYYVCRLQSNEDVAWTEESAASPGGESNVQVSWKDWRSLDFRSFRFPTDQSAIQKLQANSAISQ